MAVWTFLHMESPLNTTGGGNGLIRELTEASSRSLAFTMNEASTLSFTMPGNSRQTADIQPREDDVMVFRDGDPIQRFRVVSRALAKDSGVLTASFSAVSYKGLLDAWLFHESDKRSWPAADSATLREQTRVAWDIISTAQSKTRGNLGITRGTISPTAVVLPSLLGDPVGTYPSAYDDYFKAGDKIGASIEGLAEVDTGFDWDIVPDEANPYTGLKFMAWNVADGGRNQFAVRSDFILDDGGNLAGWSHTEVPTDYGNLIRVTGSQESTAYPTGTIPAYWWNGTANVENPAGTPPEGRWERDIQRDDLTGTTKLASAAPREYTQAHDLHAEVTVDIARGRWEGKDQLWLGDMARLIINEPIPGEPGAFVFSYDGDVKVMEVNISVDDQGAEDLDLAVIRPRFSTQRDWAELQARIARASIK